MSLVDNRVRLKKKKNTPAKKYINLQGGRWRGQTQKCTTFCTKLSFHPILTQSLLFA
jgi:hypothetical protein